jgi:hypothetical protein
LAFKGNFAAGDGVMLVEEGAGLAARHKAEIFEAGRCAKLAPGSEQGGVVDHPMVDVTVRDADLDRKVLGPATRKAREE